MNALDGPARPGPKLARLGLRMSASSGASLGVACLLVLAAAWIETVTVLHEAIDVLTG